MSAVFLKIVQLGVGIFVGHVIGLFLHEWRQ
jgi:hypothetical protein